MNPRPPAPKAEATRRPWRSVVAAMLACSLALAGPGAWPGAAAQSKLPALGDTDSAEFTVGTERKLGDEIMREIHADPDYIDDPLLLEYLETVWQPLVAASRSLGNITADIDQRFAWEPFLVRDPSVNAFALPGGFVGVHLGLIAITTTRDELASVLAHEMSHVSQRHIARSITGDSKRSLVGLAALVLGLLAASRSSSPDAMSAVVAGTQAATIQGQLNFSRDVEREADRVGFQVMTSAGFAPGGMAAMFEKMDMSVRLNDYGGFPYLRTHPLTVERIGEARARAGIAPTAPRGAAAAAEAAPSRLSVLEHTVAQARARVLMDTRVDALRRWQARDADRDGNAADKLRALSESGLASSLLRDWARADAALAGALAIVRASPNSSARAERAIVLMQAQSQLDRGAPAPAAEAMKAYAADGSRPTLLLDAQIALIATPAVAPDNAGLKANASALQTWVAVHPDDALAWSALGQTWGRLGVPLRSIRADAESRYALGDLLGAADRLRAGQRLARGGGPVDFIDASVLDSRLRVIEAQRKQILADQHATR
ncbi:MAG TPA: M48 family metalloprotease [Caldimonas sp.]|jgi:predicted Zn-dependent protease|nr:M48 family metalloprotease [Caldimonas sp.]HEV7578119.1 M48 family metalloprotease [Caldimonas sp.]